MIFIHFYEILVYFVFTRATIFMLFAALIPNPFEIQWPSLGKRQKENVAKSLGVFIIVRLLCIIIESLFAHF